MNSRYNLYKNNVIEKEKEKEKNNDDNDDTFDSDEFEQDFLNDCKEYEYIPDTLKHTSRTIAIGDIHGDLELAVKVLEICKCIEKVKKSNTKNKQTVTLINRDNFEKYYIWIGNDTQIVQVGDQVDRCRPNGDHECIFPDATVRDEASDIKILKFYYDIDQIAKKDGGRLISLLGNHELMNVSGRMRYVSLLGALQFSDKVDISSINNSDMTNYTQFYEEGLENRKKEFTNKNNNKLNKFLACTRTSAIIIGDLLFVHGGMIEKMAKLYDLKKFNKIVRKWLLGKLTDEVYSRELLKTKKEQGKNVSFNYKKRLNSILVSDSLGISPFWNRILGNLPADIEVQNLSDESQKQQIINDCDKTLKPVLKIFNINGIIVGHTPQMNDKYGINSACNRRVWRTDIGASTAFDSIRDENKKKRVQVLEITYDNSENEYKIIE
jgi:hypothetical protein